MSSQFDQDVDKMIANGELTEEQLKEILKRKKEKENEESSGPS